MRDTTRCNCSAQNIHADVEHEATCATRRSAPVARRHCIIVNRGGAVLAAFTDDPNLVVTLVDRDNIEAGDPMPTLPEGVEDSDSGLIVPDEWRDALSDAASDAPAAT